MFEWDWDLNEDLAPWTLAAGSQQRVAWRCLLNSAHVWETRVVDRTFRSAACPYHMRVRVHPSESLAAYYPWLAKQWHPTKNALRPDQVSHASARRIEWICEFGHEWPAFVYQRTLSKTGCPDCQKIESGARTKAGVMRAQAEREANVEAQIQGLILLDEPDSDEEF